MNNCYKNYSEEQGGVSIAAAQGSASPWALPLLQTIAKRKTLARCRVV
jgi:hypothetical protein